MIGPGDLIDFQLNDASDIAGRAARRRIRVSQLACPVTSVVRAGSVFEHRLGPPRLAGRPRDA